MKLLVVLSLAAGLLATTAPAASAGGAGRHMGGCSFDTNSQEAVTGPDVYDGVLWLYTVTTDSYLPPLPTTATVTCSVIVNGVEQNASNHLTVTGYGVQAGAQRTTFVASPSDDVRLCTTVHYVDLVGATDDHDCGETTQLQMPPQSFIDLLDFVFGLVDYAGTRGDPVACPVLAAHAGTYGPFLVTGEGDVYGPDPEGLFGGPWFDCPPYINGDPAAPPNPEVVHCAYGSVAGTATYAPPLGATAATHDHVMDVTASGCTGAGAAGPYVFHLAGTASDACATPGVYPLGGTGGGVLTGTAPGGPVSGTYAVTKYGARYLVRSRYTSGGIAYYADLWLDQQPVCGGTLVGDATIVRLPVGPPQLF